MCFWVSNCISFFYKKLIKPQCPIWRNTEQGGNRVKPSTNINMHFNATLPFINRYMCGALTTTAHWWVLRPASLGCSPQPDVRLPSCPSYCGGLFQCTPSPGPRTRWAAKPHKYFLSHSSRTQPTRNLSKLTWAFLCSSCVHLSIEPGVLKSPTVFKCEMNIIVPRRLAVTAVNVYYFHWRYVVTFNFSSCWGLQAKTVQDSEHWWWRPLRVSPIRGSSGITR